MLNSEDVATALIYMLSLVLSVGVHEYCHAVAVTRLSDPTAERAGRLTLNPLVHADVLGTYLMPIVAAFTPLPLIGWGKPVPFSPHLLSGKRSQRANVAIVAVAGPLGNLAFCIVLLLAAIVWSSISPLNRGIARVFEQLVTLNVLLLIFNLIPLHPLDGGKVLAALLPRRFHHIDEQLQRYGPFLLLGFFFIGAGVIARLMEPLLAVASMIWSQFVTVQA